MKERFFANMVMVMLIAICTVMLFVIFSYTENTILKADKSTAVAAFSL